MISTIQPLGSLGLFAAGVAFPPILQGRIGLEYPFAKVGDISVAAATQNGELRLTRNSVSKADILALKAKPVPARSIIFAKIGEAIKLRNQVVTVRDTLIDNNVIAFTPSEELFDLRYAAHVFRQIDMYALADKTTVPAIRKSRLEAFRIPTPPLEEQKRIAAILDKADDIRRKREQAIQLADEFLRSLFLDMFGDPVRNPKGWPTSRLGDCVRMENGSTPSKEISDYWGGDIPWVSPKDMKFIEITKSVDHITQLALDEQRARLIPRGNVLIVIRGMILAHSVPVAVNFVDCCINQDMKALNPGRLIDSVFLANTLRSLRGVLLARVATSTHGTKKLDSDVLRELVIPIPPLALQKRFTATSSKIKESVRCGSIFQQAAYSLVKSIALDAF